MENSFYYILFSIILISIVLSWIKSEKLINPVSIYVLWWGGFLFLSTFKLIGMRLPSERTYYLLFTSVVMFSIGGITYLKPATAVSKSINIPKSQSIIDRKLRLFLYFQLSFTLILLFYLSKSISLIKTMDIGVYRNMLFTEFSIFGSFRIIFTYLIEPCMYVSVLISMTGMFLYRWFPNSFLIVSILNLILYSAVTVGRAPIFIAAVSIMLSLFFALSQNRMKFKLTYILFMIIPIGFIAWISMFRRNTFDFKALNLIRDYFVWYLTGPFTAYELFADNYKVTYDWDYSYFRGIFAGIEEIFKPFIQRIFPDYQPINVSFHEITRVFRSLGGKATGHNSHYTMLYTFTRDAGVFGIIFFSYILGIVNAFLYNNFRKKMNIFTFSLMIFILYLSLIGITRWELRYTWSWLTIFGLFLIAHIFVLKNNSGSENAIN